MEQRGNKQTYNKKLLKKQIIITVVSTLGIYIAFQYFLGLLIPFIIAYLLMRMTYPLVRVLNKRLRLPICLGSFLAILLVLAVLGGIGTYVLGILLKQIKEFIKDLPYYVETVLDSTDFLCLRCDQFCGWEEGSTALYLEENMSCIWNCVRDGIMSAVSTHTINCLLGIFGFLSLLLIICIAIINLTMDYEEIHTKYKNSNFYKFISPVTSKLGSVGIAYLKTQGIIMLINMVILVAGFMIMKNKYAFLLGIGIAFMDAFPVIGSGLFLVPIAIFKLIGKNLPHAIFVLVLYGLCELVRSFVEPRVLGGKIGLKPIFTLMAMYIGFEVFGLLGFLIGPLALVIIKTILEETGCIEKKDEGLS